MKINVGKLLAIGLILQAAGWIVACLGFGFCPMWSAVLTGFGGSVGVIWLVEVWATAKL